MKTPQKPYTELANILGVQEIWLKREDLHPYGSHKGRSIPPMIKEYSKLGIKNFVISSSGNAALAALIAVQKHNQNNPKDAVHLTIYLGTQIAPIKLHRLKNELSDPKITIEQVTNPKQTAFQQEKEGITKNLRQSTDDLAIKGYFELAEDLAKIPNLQAVFIPTSSGTTAQALFEAFTKMKINIQIHVVQTSSCHPIAKTFDTDEMKEETSIAGAIVDQIAHRKEKVIQAIQESHGFGWIVTNDEIESAQKIIEKTCQIKISTNSALSIAGLQKALKKNWTFVGPIVCLITGE